VLAEVEAASVACGGVCWYPFVDAPCWDEPDNPVRWSNGLIRSDLSVDPSLSTAINSQQPVRIAMP
jgi:hypothetical protein